MSEDTPGDADLVAKEIHIPEHVAIRQFENESVALNLKTGEYFGLNAVAAHMFQQLSKASTPRELIEPLASEYGQQPEVIERDLAELLRGLADRGLVELGPAETTSA